MRYGKIVSPSLPQISQGRLTLASGDPCPSADQTAKTTLYFAPYQGDRVFLWGGADWQSYSFSERSLSLSGLSANTNHDIFLHDSAGTLTLSAVAWLSDSARASAIARRNGVWVRQSDDRLFLGTIRTVAAGQTEDSLTRRFVWNCYNRRRVKLRAVEGATSWTYANNVWRSLNNSAANRVEIAAGLSEDLAQIEVAIYAVAHSSLVVQAAVGIGVSSTTSNSADCFGFPISTAFAGGRSSLRHQPQAGYTYYQALETVLTTTPTCTWYGTGGGTAAQSGIFADWRC